MGGMGWIFKYEKIKKIKKIKNKIKNKYLNMKK